MTENGLIYQNETNALKKPDFVGQASIHRVDHMNNDILEQHPCVGKCPNFTDEQCCHCLVTEPSDRAFNLNDAVATALEGFGDDAHIENHVSPQCVVGGNQ